MRGRVEKRQDKGSGPPTVAAQLAHVWVVLTEDRGSGVQAWLGSAFSPSGNAAVLPVRDGRGTHTKEAWVLLHRAALQRTCHALRLTAKDPTEGGFELVRVSLDVHHIPCVPSAVLCPFCEAGASPQQWWPYSLRGQCCPRAGDAAIAAVAGDHCTAVIPATLAPAQLTQWTSRGPCDMVGVDQTPSCHPVWVGGSHGREKCGQNQQSWCHGTQRCLSAATRTGQCLPPHCLTTD